MAKYQKIIRVFILFFLLLLGSMLFATKARAVDPTVSIYSDQAEVEAGDTVTLTVDIYFPSGSDASGTILYHITDLGASQSITGATEIPILNARTSVATVWTVPANAAPGLHHIQVSLLSVSRNILATATNDIMIKSSGDDPPNITIPKLEVTYNEGMYKTCIALPTSNKRLTVKVHVELPQKPISVNEYIVKLYLSYQGYGQSDTYSSHLGSGTCGTNFACYSKVLDNLGSYTFDPEFTHDFTAGSELEYHEATVKLLRHVSGAGYDPNSGTDYQPVSSTVFTNNLGATSSKDLSVGWVYLTNATCGTPGDPPNPPDPDDPDDPPTPNTSLGPKIELKTEELIGGSIKKLDDLYKSTFGEGTTTGILVIIISAGALIGVFWTGFLFLTAGGDQKKLEQAKKSALYIAIGLVAGTLSYTIILLLVNLIKKF